MPGRKYVIVSGAKRKYCWTGLQDAKIEEYYYRIGDWD